MIKEKDLLRKQIYKALDQDDFETAKSIMSGICKKEKFKKQEKWPSDQIEFLMHHVEAMGKEVAFKLVAKKLDRNIAGVKRRYNIEIKRLKKLLVYGKEISNENGCL